MTWLLIPFILGALATFSDVQKHETLRTEFPLLCQAAAETGGIANQNRGTIGGNIANASPAADTPPALLVYDAELEIVVDARPAPGAVSAVSHRLQADGSGRRTS